MGKPFTWNQQKNEWLKKNRGISFEEVVDRLATDLLDVRQNTSKRHPLQLVFIVKITNYIWVVPFEESETEIQLKIAFPDRRLAKEFKLEK
mgnify:CR=1 FL=1